MLRAWLEAASSVNTSRSREMASLNASREPSTIEFLAAASADAGCLPMAAAQFLACPVNPSVGSSALPAQVVPVRIGAELRAGLKAHAADDNITTSEVIREALRRFLDVA